jgi:hypothetical protein
MTAPGERAAKRGPLTTDVQSAPIGFMDED